MPPLTNYKHHAQNCSLLESTLVLKQSKNRGWRTYKRWFFGVMRSAKPVCFVTNLRRFIVADFMGMRLREFFEVYKVPKIFFICLNVWNWELGRNGMNNPGLPLIWMRFEMIFLKAFSSFVSTVYLLTHSCTENQNLRINWEWESADWPQFDTRLRD